MLIAGTWGLSLFYCCAWVSRNPPDESGWIFGVVNNVVGSERIGADIAYPYPEGWSVTRVDSYGESWWMYYRPWCGRPEVTRNGVVVPLWMPLLLVALPTALLFWRDRRRTPPGHCQRCGYDLSGNTSGICPECGGAVPNVAALASKAAAQDGKSLVD